MNWLFVHRRFPGQFVHVVRYLAAKGDRVIFISHDDGQISRIRELSSLQRILYRTPKRRKPAHKYLARMTQCVINGEAVAAAAERLRKGGFRPDLIVGHSGWGELLYLKDVWPNTPLLGYFEFFWRSSGYNIGFDKEFPVTPAARVRTTNAVDLISLEAVDRGLTATEFQRSTYPECYRRRLSVIHEGVDTALHQPDAKAQVWLNNGVSLTRDNDVITYCARSLEPHRGFHIFMRALPRILHRNSNAHVLIVGGDEVCYDSRPSGFKTYREQLLAEVGDQLDLDRVHFVGQLNYHRYRAVLQVSSVHVYLTYPFVLSWSLIEAMACGCLIVGSKTPPVEEVVSDGRNGLLVDFMDHESLADRVNLALRSPQRFGAIRTAAREVALKRFDLRTVCLPAQLRLFNRLASRK